MYNVIIPIMAQSTNKTSKEITTLGDIIQEMRKNLRFLAMESEACLQLNRKNKLNSANKFFWDIRVKLTRIKYVKG